MGATYRLDSGEYQNSQDKIWNSLQLYPGRTTLITNDSINNLSSSNINQISFELMFSPHGVNRISLLNDIYISKEESGSGQLPAQETTVVAYIDMLVLDNESNQWIVQESYNLDYKVDDVILNKHGYETIYAQFDHELLVPSGGGVKYILTVMGNSLDYHLGVVGRILLATGRPNGQRDAEWGSDWLDTQGTGDSQPARVFTTPVSALNLGLGDVPEFASPDDVELAPDGSTFQESRPVAVSDRGRWSYDGGAGTSGEFAGAGSGGVVGVLSGARAVFGRMVEDGLKAFASFMGLGSIVSGLDSRDLNRTLVGSTEPLMDRIEGALSASSDDWSSFDYDRYSRETEQDMRGLLGSVMEQLGWAGTFVRTMTLGVHQSDVSFSVHSGSAQKKFGGHKDTFLGSMADDHVSMGRKSDVAFGLAGSDFLRGGQGHDTLVGGGGQDTLRGDAGKDILNGGAASDRIFGGSGDDELYGSDGHDRLSGGVGRDRLRARLRSLTVPS